jgi:hypothetical protein
MSHANAGLTPAGRRLLVRWIQSDPRPMAHIAHERASPGRPRRAGGSATSSLGRQVWSIGPASPTPVPGERPAWSSTKSWDYGVGSGSARPGDLVHVDIKKLGRIPSGGGHRARGRRTGIPPRPRDRLRLPHVAVDDHSRLAYVELLADEHDHGCADF